MMKMLRAFGRNPENPKNIQIPFMAFIGITEFWEMIDPGSLTDEQREAYDYIRNALNDKKSRILNRQTYTAIVQAQTTEEKQAAFENYKATKGIHT